MRNPHFYNKELGPLNDFKNFLFLVFQFLGLPSPTPIQYDIADYLQYGPKRSIIMAFRGIGKSYITAAFVVWLFLINPQWKILVVSASEKKAKEFATLVKQLIDGMPMCAHLKPSKEQRDSVLSFDVGPATPAKDPSLNVAGITGQITGGRADFIIPDDVETPDNSATVTQREKLADKVKEFGSILKTDPWCAVKYLGTPHTEQSLYLDLAGTKGYELRIWPARYPKNMDKYAGRLAPKIAHALLADDSLVLKPTDTRFNDLQLRERELELGATAFQLNYMLDPTLSDEERYPLKLKDFLVAAVNPDVAPVRMAWAGDPRYQVVDPSIPNVGLNGDRYYRPFYVSDDWIPYEHKLMAVDPSGRGGDDTAYVVLYYLKGLIYIAEWGRTRGGYEESDLVALARVAARHKVNLVKLEDNFGDGMFTQLLKPVLARYHRCGVEEVHSKGQKEKRICDTLEPVMGAHRIVIDEKVIRDDARVDPKFKQFLYQLTHLTRDKGALKHDDGADVLAIGVAHYVESLAQDLERVEQAHQESRKEAVLEAFIRRATKGRTAGRDHGAWLELEDTRGDSLEEALMENAPWWEQ